MPSTTSSSGSAPASISSSVGRRVAGRVTSDLRSPTSSPNLSCANVASSTSRRYRGWMLAAIANTSDSSAIGRSGGVLLARARYSARVPPQLVVDSGVQHGMQEPVGLGYRRLAHAIRQQVLPPPADALRPEFDERRPAEVRANVVPQIALVVLDTAPREATLVNPLARVLSQRDLSGVGVHPVVAADVRLKPPTPRRQPRGT